MKNLRRILGVPPTYVDRTWTNDRVHEECSVAAGKPIWRFSEIYDRQRLKLFGHVLRADQSDPLHEVTFHPGTWTPRRLTKRRNGQPRKNWAAVMMEEAYEGILHYFNCGPFLPFTWDEPALTQWIVDAARARIVFFATKPPITNKKAPFRTSNADLDAQFPEYLESNDDSEEDDGDNEAGASLKIWEYKGVTYDFKMRKIVGAFSPEATPFWYYKGHWYDNGMTKRNVEIVDDLHATTDDRRSPTPHPNFRPSVPLETWSTDGTAESRDEIPDPDTH